MNTKGKTVFKPQHSVRRDTGELKFFLFPMHMLQGMPGGEEEGEVSKAEKELSAGAEFSGTLVTENLLFGIVRKYVAVISALQYVVFC